MIQVLMVASVLFGLVWLLGIIAGLNHMNDAEYLNQFQLPHLYTFFSQPLWVWLGVLSLGGLMGAGSLFLSFHIGVKSIIRFQVVLLHQLFKTINQSDSVEWLSVVKDEPRKKTHRIIKTSVQLTGLVIRRLVRMLIPFMTFVVAFVVLIQLDGPLLLNLIPLAMMYILVLYFINRYAARNQVKLTGVAEVANKQVGTILDDLLFQKRQFGQPVKDEIDQSEYRQFSALRYKRRLVEIHVVWVNSLFLVFGSALIIWSYATQVNASSIDWMHLILFLVALRYAANGLQEMASSTVAFSRFLPETELVYQLLNAKPDKSKGLNFNGLVFYFSSNNQIDALLPNLLKLEYGVDNSVLLEKHGDIESLFKDKDEASLWVYSSKPAKFFQAVMHNKTLVSNILVSVGGVTEHYDNVDEFQLAFNPQQFVKKKPSDDMLYDDEMY